VTLHLCCLVVVACALTACGPEGPGREVAVTTPASASANVSAGDRAWLTAIHQSGLADIQYGKLAERKGATSAVRRAGTMLATDHAAFDKMVMRVADGLGVELPTTERTDRLAEAQQLEKESGSRFDRDFVVTMTDEHRTSVAATEREVREGESPEVTALARTALPALKGHLEMLRRASPVG
jgi:putative membrane protein